MAPRRSRLRGVMTPFLGCVKTRAGSGKPALSVPIETERSRSIEGRSCVGGCDTHPLSIATRLMRQPRYHADRGEHRCWIATNEAGFPRTERCRSRRESIRQRKRQRNTRGEPPEARLNQGSRHRLALKGIRAGQWIGQPNASAPRIAADGGPNQPARVLSELSTGSAIRSRRSRPCEPQSMHCSGPERADRDHAARGESRVLARDIENDSTAHHHAFHPRTPTIRYQAQDRAHASSPSPTRQPRASRERAASANVTDGCL